MNNYEKEMLEKIDSGIELTEYELSELVLDYNEVDREADEPRRWSRSINSIIQLGDRYFSIEWEQGLTEMQENEFWNQPVEVKRHSYEKTIMVTEWREI